jgi:hypothetical protein
MKVINIITSLLLSLVAVQAQTCATHDDCLRVPCPRGRILCEPAWCRSGRCGKPLCRLPSAQCPVRTVCLAADPMIELMRGLVSSRALLNGLFLNLGLGLCNVSTSCINEYHYHPICVGVQP